MSLRSRHLTITLCAALLASVGCASRTSNESNAGTTSSAGSGGASAGGGVISANDKPLDVMTRAAHAQLDAKSYHARIVNSLPSGASNTIQVDYAAPDRYHMTTRSQGNGRESTLEFIIVGKDSFVRTNFGEWKRFPGDLSQFINALRDPKLIDEIAKSGDAKLVGSDTLDGAPMLVYSYTTTNALGMNVKSETKTWVAVSDGLPRKTEAEGEVNGMKVKSAITISDYNTDIKIEPPTTK